MQEFCMVYKISRDSIYPPLSYHKKTEDSSLQIQGVQQALVLNSIKVQTVYNPVYN
jgi:hypothetical protein